MDAPLMICHNAASFGLFSHFWGTQTYGCAKHISFISVGLYADLTIFQLQTANLCVGSSFGNMATRPLFQSPGSR